MNKLQKVLIGIDLLLLCIVAGKAVTQGAVHLSDYNEKNGDDQPVMQVEQPTETSFDVSTQDMAQKKVALTFDDGPNAIYTETLLDGLRERGVHATFFLLGEEVEKCPEIVKQMYEDGHLIGNHSYEHVNLGSLTDEAAIEQVDKTNKAIYNVTGEYPEYIRPPFGCWKSNLDYQTTMIEVLWNVDPLDWKTNNTEVVVERVLKDVEENDIILLHDASETSVNAAFQIIDRLQSEGYVFVTVDEILFD